MSDAEIRTVPVVVEPEYIFDIEGMLWDTRGQSLEDIAQDDPLEAYRIVRLAILYMTEHADRARSPDGLLIASAEEDGPETPKKVARAMIEEAFPAILTEPLRVELSKYDIPDGFTREARTKDRAKQLVVAFTVEPPSLA